VSRPAAIALTLALAAFAAATAPSPAAAKGRGATGSLRMNEIQVIGTHNSYHRELSKPELAAHDAIYGG
jgi:Phosphoinositide phospholipase C, Ca2+-dependent